MTIAGNVTANYISLNELHTFAPEVYTTISGSYDATTLSGVISRASAMVDNYLGYTLPIETIENEKTDGIIDSGGNLVITPRKRPVVDVTAVTIRKGNDEIVLSLLDGSAQKYDIPEPKTRFVYPNAELSTSSISTIANFHEIRNVSFFTEYDYRAGFETIPDDIKEAATLYVREILARRSNTVGASEIRQGGMTIKYESRKGEKSDLVLDAESILSRYRRVI